MKKKLLTMLLAGCMVLSVTACGEKEKDTVVENTEQTENALGTSSLLTLGEYKGLTYVPTDTNVTDAQVDEQVSYLLAMSVTKENQEVVTENSVVNIDYVGTKDGVAFEGGTAQGQQLDIANSHYIDGFAESIVGMKVGETKDCPMKFPEDYGAAELSGAEVVFTITVNECWTEKTAELNDEFAKTQGYDNVDALYAGVRADYEANLLAQAETSQATQLLEKIVADSAFNMNEEEIQLYVDYAMEQQKSMAESYGFDMETYASIYGMTVEQLEESCREYAMYQIQVPLVRFEIAEAEGLKVTDKIYKELATEMMAGYGFESLEEFEAAYDKAIIEKMVLEEMAINFVMEHSVAEERIVPEETE